MLEGGTRPDIKDIMGSFLGPSFEMKKVTRIVLGGVTPEGTKWWKKVRVTVPRDVTKSPPPNFPPHSGDAYQLPLRGVIKKTTTKPGA